MCKKCPILSETSFIVYWTMPTNAEFFVAKCYKSNAVVLNAEHCAKLHVLLAVPEH